MVFFFLCLTYSTKVYFLGLSMLLQMAAFHFLWPINIPLHVFLSQLFIDQHLGCLHVLAIINSAMNIRVPVSFWIRVFIFLGYIPRSWVAGSYGSSIFSFLRNLHTVFHCGWANLHIPTSSVGRFPFLPFYHLQHLLFIDFLMISFLTGMRW